MSAFELTKSIAPCVPRATLPPRMTVLVVGAQPGSSRWLAEAFSADSASDMELTEAVGAAHAMALLRDAVFDALLVQHDADRLDALDFVEGLRASSTEEAVIVVGRESDQEMAALAFEVGADAYCSTATTTTRTLLWTLARAIDRHQLLRENRRLVQAERQRLQYEHQEAERLLSQQRALVEGIHALQGGQCGQPELPASRVQLERKLSESAPTTFSESLLAHYRELLRAYVIMGSGNLTEEMNRLAERLTAIGITARQAVQLHVHALEELIRGLGNRSARHVMNRADLLVLEVLVHLSEGYRTRYQELREAS